MPTLGPHWALHKTLSLSPAALKWLLLCTYIVVFMNNEGVIRTLEVIILNGRGNTLATPYQMLQNFHPWLMLINILQTCSANLNLAGGNSTSDRIFMGSHSVNEGYRLVI